MASFVSYALIGLIATSAHYSILLALVEHAHFSPAPASTLGAGVGALVSYAANRQLTFTDCSRPHQITLPRFLFVATLGLVMNGAIVWAGTAILGWYYLVAQMVATLATVLATYELNRSWSFA